MPFKNKSYYEILEVSVNSSLEEIKIAYKRKALKYHPDINPEDREGAAKKFKELNKAYSVLSDPAKRKQYDTYGSDEQSFFSNNNFDSFNDFFADIFNMSPFSSNKRKQSSKGKDSIYELSLTLEEAFFGKETSIDIDEESICSTCKGTGAESIQNCKYCNGNGVNISNDGFFTIQTTCQYCNGSGQKIKIYCPKCNGAGLVSFKNKLKIKIPAGIDDGSKIRIPNKGHISLSNGENGDLFISVLVLKHDVFIRKGCDLFYECEIDMVDAALGIVVNLTLIDGEIISLNIPPGTQYGDRMCIANKGMYKINSSFRGDIYIISKIIISKKLTLEEHNLLRKIQESRKN